MKKGFTLVELLAVILILGLIAGISFSVIPNIINKSRISTYNDNITRIKNVTDVYIANGKFGYMEVGDIKELPLQDLIDNEYIEEIKSPFDKNKKCNGYIMVSKLEEGKYEYIPHINCYGDINNSEENKLILHYTFNDFQEPTVNLSQDISTFSSVHYSNRTKDEIITQIETPIGIKNAIKISGLAEDNLDTAFRLMSKYLNVESNKPYIFSFYSYTDDSNISRWERRSGSDWSTIIVWYDSSNTEISREYLSKNEPVKLKTWERFYIYSNSPTNAKKARLYIGLDSPNIFKDKYILITSPQFEQKDYITPFTVETREGIIKDYSGNGNDTILNLNRTPQWTEKGYYFDGNRYFETDYKIEGLKNYSISIWVNVSKDFEASKYNRFIGTEDWGAGRLGIMLHSTGKIATNTYFGSGYDYWLYPEVYPNSEEWFHMVVTFDRKGEEVIYYNGEYVGSRDISPAQNISWSSEKIRIACGDNSSVYLRHKGYLDNIRIYERVLSSEEVKQIYYMERKL